MKNEFIFKKGYNFKFDQLACEKCGGACCTGASGYIWTKYEEIVNISEFLGLSVDDFAKRYLRKFKYHYSLIEKKIDKKNYACIFFDLEKKRCSIYPVRPSQCRTFPFWEEFKDSDNKEDLKDECPGVIYFDEE